MVKSTRNGFSHRGELNFWSKKWFKIESHAYPFYSLIEKCDYHEFLYNLNIYKDIRDKVQKMYGTLHDDFVLEKSVEKAGYKGIHTKALRFKIIGKKGHYSFSKDLWERLHFEKVQLHDVGNVNKYILV